MHTRVTVAHVYTAHHHQVGGVRGAQSSEDRGPLVVGSTWWWWGVSSVLLDVNKGSEPVNNINERETP